MRFVNRDRDDRGAVLVWVALMLTVLLGVGAIVIDAGALYAERRQLQNGADAAALAVAADCAAGDCLDEKATAEKYADENANDKAANVDEVCGSGTSLADTTCQDPPAGTTGATGWVQVTTSTHNPASTNDKQVKFVLAPVLDAANVGRTVHASAAAAWGPIGSATTLPVAFSVCEYRNLGGTLDGSVFPQGLNYIYLHGDNPAPDGAGYEDCPASPSGQDVPGGFGWLEPDVGCSASVDFDGWVGGDTGRSAPCTLDLHVGQEVLIPLYDEALYQGSHAEYHIIGFVGLTIDGYKFQNDYLPKPGMKKCGTQDGLDELSGDVDCIRGHFTRMTTMGDGFGGGTDYGGHTVAMIA